MRAVHRRVHGTAPDGRHYAASDPHLLSWVHVAEVVSFLRSHQRFGAAPLTAGRGRRLRRPGRRVARALGAVDVPATVAEVDDLLAAYRPELAGTPAARATARYLVANPPLPLVLRGAYLPLAGAAVALLPRWARWPLRLPWLPVTEATVVRGRRRAGHPGDPLGAAGGVTTPRCLASGSPRRRELLALLGVEFTVVAPDVDETPRRRRGAARPRPPARRRQGARPSTARAGARRRHHRRDRRRGARQAGRRRRRPPDAAAAVRADPPRPHRRRPARPAARWTSRSSPPYVTMVADHARPRSTGTSPPASRSTRPAPTPSRAPAACSSSASGAAPATSSGCRWPTVRRRLLDAGDAGCRRSR